MASFEVPGAVRRAETRSREEVLALEHIIPDEVVDMTCDLIRGKGENPGGVEADTVYRLVTLCQSVGAEVTLHEVSPGRSNLHAVIGDPDGPAILFLGHSDVVPAGEGWTGDPFEPRIEDGAIIGRGATDMKGGLAAVVATMRAVNQVRPDLRLELLCTVDEEDLATGVKAYIESTPARDYVACIVAEPTDLDVVISCRGATNFSVRLTGESAHAGRPEDGASAILAAGEVIQAVRDAHDARDHDPADLLGGPSWSIGTITAGSATSMVPRFGELAIDRRTMPGEKPEAILDELLEDVRRRITASTIARKDRIVVDGSVDMVMPGFRTSPDADLAQIACTVIEGLGYNGTPTGWTAACEGGFIAEHHGVPTVILGPGDVNTQAHQPDEQVLIDDLVAAAHAYVLIALRLGSPASENVTSHPRTNDGP